MSFEAGYEKLFRDVGIALSPEDGDDEESLLETESRLGVRLPRALRDYYAKAGKHGINLAHNRLIELSKLAFADDFLVFLDESRSVAVWGIPRSCLNEDDPTVWQGENGTPIVWHTESLTVSKFLAIGLYWQAACGGLTFAGSATDLDAKIVGLLERNWPNVSTHNKMRFFVKEGQILILNDEGEGVFSLLAAGTSLDQFEAIDSVLGVDWDWSIFDELEVALDDDNEEDEQ